LIPIIKAAALAAAAVFFCYLEDHMRKFVIGLTLAVVTISLAGCGDSKSKQQPKLSGTPDPKVQGPVGPGDPNAGGKGAKNQQKASID
jgi:hypothetical protein